MKSIKKYIVAVFAIFFIFVAIPLIQVDLQAEAIVKSPVQVKNLKAKAADDYFRIKLTWNKASYAKKNQIYEKH